MKTALITVAMPRKPTRAMLKAMSKATFLSDGSTLEMERRFNGLLGAVDRWNARRKKLAQKSQ